MKKLYPMFNIVKLSAAPDDPILEEGPDLHHCLLLSTEKRSGKWKRS